MFPAEGADGIHDPIHLPEGHTMHPLVQILEGSLDGISVGVIALMVIGKEHLQNGTGITTVVGWVIRHILPQYRNIFIHQRHRLSSLPASFCHPGGSCSGTADTRPLPDIP